MTVSLLLASTNSAELTEWMAWHELQREQSDRGAASVADPEEQLRKILGVSDGR